MNLLKSIYAYSIRFVSVLFGLPFAKKFDTYVRFKRKLNLNHPQSLADKVAYLELFELSSLKSYCTDKYSCREYVTKKGFSNILIPAYTEALTDFEQLNFENLPSKFVIKATHGCRMNLVIQNKEQINVNSIREEVRSWLSTTYGLVSIEPHYLKIEHRFYVEKFMGVGLIDYKIHCLNGIPEFILVCSNRESVKGGGNEN